MPDTRYDSRKHPTLRRGARGDAVVRMQKRLCAHHDDLDKERFSDGIFGPGTEQQVKRFQRAKQLSVDGIVGRNSWTALLKEPGAAIASPAGQTASSADRKRAKDEAGGGATPGTGLGAKSGGGLAKRVQDALKKKGYSFLDDGKPHHLNIVGVRSPSTAIGDFDDRMILVYRDGAGQMQAVEYSITTDPGDYYTKTKLLNKAGAAILVPGQYKQTYKVAKHRGKYDALCQLGGEVTVWRDGNKDDKLDRSGKTYKGWYGINIHRARSSGTTERVGRYSAGCQVFQNADDFAVLMDLARKSNSQRSERFTYTLLEEADL